MGDRGTFGKHIETAVAKAEEKVSISRILPNMGRSASGRREVLCSVVHNILLYGVPIWYEDLKKRACVEGCPPLRRVSIQNCFQGSAADYWKRNMERQYKVQWTKRLIPRIKPWLQCKYRKLDY